MFGGASIRRNQNDLIAFFSVNQRTAIPCACFAPLGREQHAGDTLPVVPFGSVGRDIGVDVLAHPLGRAIEDWFGGSGVLGDDVAHDGERNLAGVKGVRKVQFSLLVIRAMTSPVHSSHQKNQGLLRSEFSDPRRQALRSTLSVDVRMLRRGS